ncbi:MAG TPA: branched-chain amino acid ABC transporter permease [Thermodesulfobacteriota bacterium]
MPWFIVVEQILNGLVLGAIYAIMASGLSLIWGSLKMLNFAHGEFYMLGGYGLYLLLLYTGLPLGVAVPICVAAVYLAGWLVERAFVQPLLDKPGWDVSPLIATLGISIVLQNLALRLLGERIQSLPYFVEGTLALGSVRIAWHRVLILLVSGLVIAAFVSILKTTRLGMALRATAQDRDAATLQGINVRGVYAMTFGLSAALAALAGTMLAPIFSVSPWMGAALLGKAFVVCVLGGLGSLEGAILGGVILGTVESLAVVLWSSEWKDVVSFIVLIGVLWVRPAGLFGTREW